MVHIIKNYFQNISIKNSNYFFRSLLVIISCFISFNHVSAANITLSPSQGTHHVGETFSIDVYVSSNQDAINAASANIIFSSETLELTSVRKTGSIITMWAEEPSFSNATGKASFEGVILNPGFNGSQGKLITLSFRVKKVGVGTVSVLAGSVLANDGEATNVLGTLGSASFTLDESTLDDASDTSNAVVSSLTPRVKSSSYPDSTKWYSSKEASFEWDVPESVTAVKTLYDDDTSSIPTRVYDPPVTNRSFVVDKEGIMYIHVQFKSLTGWGEVSHFKFQVDLTPPSSIHASLVDGSVTSSPKPNVLVTATDTLSGVGTIGIIVDSDKEVLYPYTTSNLYALPKKEAGKHTAKVAVYDKAGNKGDVVTLDYTIETILVPTVTDYTKHVELGNPLVVSGTTYPQGIIEVSLTDTYNTKQIQTTTADESGKFSLTWLKKLDTGGYEMHVRVIDSKGAVSDFTETKIVTLEHIPLIRFGIFIMNWLSLILVTIIASTLILGTIWYSLVQFSRFRRKVKRTMREAQSSLKANVFALRRDTEEFHTLLVKAEKKRQLTKEETAILKKFKKRLDVTEKEIEKKLEQIG
jgi:hypothetical protein